MLKIVYNTDFKNAIILSTKITGRSGLDNLALHKFATISFHFTDSMAHSPYKLGRMYYAGALCFTTLKWQYK